MSATTVNAAAGPLAGVRIVDLSRLAPGPYATMLLADLGAEVVVVGGGRAGTQLADVARGKTFVSLDLKSAAGRSALHRLVETADVLVESFRPGVAERLGAGYDELAALSPGLIYCSLTGYGQDGPYAQEAGHDINYLSLTGVLGSMGPAGSPPSVPLNLIADFAGGSLLAAFAISSALYERERSGEGQHLDVAMIDGVQSMMAMYFSMWRTSAMPERGHGIMDGACPFYRCYECADGRWVAVGALEPQFFDALWQGLGLGETPAQYPRDRWPAIETALASALATRTRDDWAEFFYSRDACVTPVLDPDEVAAHPQVMHRHGHRQAENVPPVPLFSRTPARAGDLDRTDRTHDLLGRLGWPDDRIQQAHDTSTPAGLDGWPAM